MHGPVEYMQTFKVYELGDTIEAAIAKVRADHPRSQVWGVSHLGLLSKPNH